MMIRPAWSQRWCKTLRCPMAFGLRVRSRRRPRQPPCDKYRLCISHRAVSGLRWAAAIIFDRMGNLEIIERVAIRAARAAGRIHLRRLSHTTASRKSNAIDLVTEADHEAEAAILDVLQREFPDHTILTEEGSGNCTLTGDNRWIIDPLDGTTNFAHTYPQFCVSIAYESRGRIQLGVIFDALKKELFVARRGAGAWLNRRPIRVSQVRSLETSLLATGFPYDRRERRRFYLCFWEAFMMRTQGVRRTGAAALDLAYVASSRTDGFWEFGLKAWDVGAGALLVEEAGGRVSNMDGSALDIHGGNIIATNRRIHAQMVTTIEEVRPEAERRHAEMLRESHAAA